MVTEVRLRLRTPPVLLVVAAVAAVAERKEESWDTNSLVLADLPPEVAAAEAVAKDLCNWAAEAGLEVHQDQEGSPALDRRGKGLVRDETMHVMVVVTGQLC